MLAAIGKKNCIFTYNRTVRQLLHNRGCIEPVLTDLRQAGLSSGYHAHSCCLRAAARDARIRATDAIAARASAARADRAARRKPN